MTKGVAVFSARRLHLGALLVGALLTASCGGSGGSSPHVVTASPPPPPGIVFVPASLAFAGVGAVNASTVKASESGYSGDFTINTSSSSCLNGSSTIAGKPPAIDDRTARSRNAIHGHAHSGRNVRHRVERRLRSFRDLTS
jgi:hypothetical protein